MKKEKSKTSIPEATGKKDKDKKAAWIAVRCAAAVGQAIRSRLLLTGRSTTMVNYYLINTRILFVIHVLHTVHEMHSDTTGYSDVTSRSIDAKAQTDLPEFAMLDMISSYVLGERKRVYKGRAKTANFK